MNKKELLTDKSQKATSSLSKSAKRELAIQYYYSTVSSLSAIQKHLKHHSHETTRNYYLDKKVP